MLTLDRSFIVLRYKNEIFGKRILLVFYLSHSSLNLINFPLQFAVVCLICAAQATPVPQFGLGGYPVGGLGGQGYPVGSLGGLGIYGGYGSPISPITGAVVAPVGPGVGIGPIGGGIYSPFGGYPVGGGYPGGLGGGYYGQPGGFNRFH